MTSNIMQFHLDPEQVRFCERHPFRNNFNPLKAAYGRVAEPRICEILQKHFNVIVMPYNYKYLPQEYKKVLGKDKWHDGLIFDNDGNFLGIFEGKLALRDVVRLNHEVEIAKYCALNGLIYILGIAKMVDVATLLCEVKCFTPLNEHLNLIQENTEVSVAEAIKFNKSLQQHISMI